MPLERDELAKELDPVLEAYDKMEPAAEKQLDPEREQAFLSKFERLRVESIMPVMHHVGKYLEERKHSYHVEEDIGPSDGNPSIKMRIYPRTPDGSIPDEHEFPVITFVAEPDIGSVAIELLNGMPGRPGTTKGHVVPIDLLTVEYIKSQIVGLIKINFGKKPSK